MRIQENLEKSKYEADGSLQIQGTTIPYHTICEDNFFVDEENNPVASIFSYAYFRSDIQDNSKRPILFIYNGGPGCASLWLHMGLFGPRIVKLDDELNLPTVPPFELEDNPHCLLDLCDLVFIDPVGTGLGRLIQEKARKEFYETHGDVRSVSKFIEQQNNSKTAIASGELMGKKLSGDKEVASVNDGNFVSENQTDFIFAVAGEEYGFSSGSTSYLGCC